MLRPARSDQQLTGCIERVEADGSGAQRPARDGLVIAPLLKRSGQFAGAVPCLGGQRVGLLILAGDVAEAFLEPSDFA
jgi:hypothetical protein